MNMPNQEPPLMKEIAKIDAWTIAYDLNKLDGNEPSDGFKAMVAKEIRGQVTPADIREYIRETHKVIKDQESRGATESEHKGVLINKFGLEDRAKLQIAEVDCACLAVRELFENPMQGDFNFERLLRVHQMLFRDIYEWAGSPRTVNITKSEKVLNGLSVEYARHENIEAEATGILARLGARNWERMSFEDRVQYLSGDIADLWKVHPFREGNTRTTLLLMFDFAESRGIPLERKLLARRTAYVRDTLVAASAKFSDLGDLSQPQHWIERVETAMKHAART
jgi:cell filamentation protein